MIIKNKKAKRTVEITESSENQKTSKSLKKYQTKKDTNRYDSINNFYSKIQCNGCKKWATGNYLVIFQIKKEKRELKKYCPQCAKKTDANPELIKDLKIIPVKQPKEIQLELIIF
jgi:ribosomal protein L33